MPHNTKEKRNAYLKIWYARNREHIRSLQRIYESTDKAKSVKKAWAERNREMLLVAARISKKKHRESQRIYNREWRRKNHEHANARDTAYRKSHPSEHIVYRLNRRKKQHNIAGECTPSQIEARFRYHGNHCVYCGGKAQHVDHMIPVSRGGTNWPSNLVPACHSCNSRKARKTFKEYKVWLASRPVVLQRIVLSKKGA